jgi:sugar lactone lactonase YvrE
MKRACFSVLLFLLTCFFIPAPAWSAPYIAVLELDAKGGVSNDEASIIADRLRAQLIQTGVFRVLERSRMESLLKEQGFQQSLFCDDTQCKAQIGKLLGVEGLVIGAVSRLDSVYTLSIRVLDVQRGIILKEEFYDCECPLRDVLTQVAPYLVARLINQSPSSTPLTPNASELTNAPPSLENKIALPQTGLQVSTLTGTGWGGLKDGGATESDLNLPVAILDDGSGQLIFADANNHRIRRVSKTGYTRHLAGTDHEIMGKSFSDGNNHQARFNFPSAMALHPNGLIYVADTNNNRIRVMNTAGEVSTLAGTGAPGFHDGNPAIAQFDHPRGIAIDANGTIYVADSVNHRIRKVSENGHVSTVAGNGSPGFVNGRSDRSQLNFPTALSFSHQGDLIIADTFNHSIRKLSASGELSTLAGNGEEGFRDGSPDQAMFRYPRGLAIGKAGEIYIADTNNNRIRALTPEGRVITVVGTSSADFMDGNAAVARFNGPVGLTMDDEGILYVADSKNHRIRKISFR